jgi:hypothetical protein
VSRELPCFNMGNPAVPPEWEETKTAARSLGLQAELLDVRSQGDLDRAFELAVRHDHWNCFGRVFSRYGHVLFGRRLFGKDHGNMNLASNTAPVSAMQSFFAL